MFKYIISILLFTLLLSCNRTVAVTSNPEKFSVTINNTIYESPVSIKIPDGQYDIVIEADGYDKLQTSIVISKDSTSFEYKMEPSIIKFNLNVTPDNAKVFIQNSDYSFDLNSGENEIRAGNYLLSVQSPFYIDMSEEIEIDIIDDFSLDIEMEPEVIDIDKYTPGTESLEVELNAIFDSVLELPLEDYIYRLTDMENQELIYSFNDYLVKLIEQNESAKLITLLEAGASGKIEVNYPGRYSYYQSTFKDDDVDSFSRMFELDAYKNNFIYSQIINSKAYKILEYILENTTLEDLNRKLNIKDDIYNLYGVHHVVFQCGEDKQALKLFIDRGVNKDVYEIGYPFGVSEILDVSSLVMIESGYAIEKKRFRDPRYTDPRFDDATSSEYEIFSEHDLRFIEFLRATSNE